MISLLLTLVHAEHKLLGPCYLYDRFCLEVFWKPTKSEGNPFARGGAPFGKAVNGDFWQVSPETHYKGCFTGVPECRKSGIALVCRKQGEQQYVKTYVSNSLESGASEYPGYSVDNNDPTDYNTFFKYIEESPKSNDYCVTLEAEVGGEQPLDEHSSFNAKYITKVRNILDSNQCKNYPASVETDVASGPVVPPMAATCATYSCTSGFVVDSTKTNAVCTSSCNNAECCKDNKTNDDENTVKTVRMVPGDSSAATTTTATSGAIVVAMLMYYAY